MVVLHADRSVAASSELVAARSPVSRITVRAGADGMDKLAAMFIDNAHSCAARCMRLCAPRWPAAATSAGVGAQRRPRALSDVVCMTSKRHSSCVSSVQRDASTRHRAVQARAHMHALPRVARATSERRAAAAGRSRCAGRRAACGHPCRHPRRAATAAAVPQQCPQVPLDCGRRDVVAASDVYARQCVRARDEGSDAAGGHSVAERDGELLERREAREHQNACRMPEQYIAFDTAITAQGKEHQYTNSSTPAHETILDMHRIAS
jgi:hypothetical protein